jgi:hypothetical protein
MEVRAKGGKGPLLFEWNPDTRTVDLVRKDMYYKIQLSRNAYCIKEERSKYGIKKNEPHKN